VLKAMYGILHYIPTRVGILDLNWKSRDLCSNPGCTWSTKL